MRTIRAGIVTGQVMLKILGGIGAILVLILGNAAWEFLFKPIVTLAGNFLVDLATLGIQAFRDGIYIEIAKNSHERIAAYIYSLLLAVVLAPALAAASAMTVALPRLSSKSIDEYVGSKNSRKRRIFFSLSFLLLCTCTIFIAQFAQALYITRATDHINQMQRVIAPYISQEERTVFASRVAQIAKESDYRAVLSDMEKIARNNHLIIPTFDIR